MHIEIYLFSEHLYRTVSLHLVRSVFDNIYNLPPHISCYNFMSGIVNPDGLKSPILSDELNLLRLNGINMLVRID
jgi:hypothetical protein